MRNFLMICAAGIMTTAAANAQEIAHDSEYYVLESQHAEQWAADDSAVDAKLAAFREGNGA
jgi:arylsulfatase